MPGFDCNRFPDLKAIESLSVLADDFKCGICLQVLDNTLVTRCEHTFCHECLNQWLSRPQTTKECPECQYLLTTRKRSLNHTNEVVIKGNVFVDRNPRIDKIIGKFRIRCDYEWNGCPEVCPLKSLPTHLKTCQYRLCQTCGLSMGPITDDHNCIEGLKTDRNEWQMKCNEWIEKDKEFDIKTKEMETKIKELETKLKESEERALNLESKCKQTDGFSKDLKTKLEKSEEKSRYLEMIYKQTDDLYTKLIQKYKDLETKLKKSEEKSRDLEVKYKQTDGLHKELVQKYKELETSAKTSKVVAKQEIPFAVIPKSLFFGKYEPNVGSIEFQKYGIVFNSVVTINMKKESVTRICLTYTDIQCLYACVEASPPMICIKPNNNHVFIVDTKTHSITDLINNCSFDCNSEDASERFIIIELRDVLNKTFVSQLCAKCVENNNLNVEYKLLGPHTAQLMLKKAMKAIN